MAPYSPAFKQFISRCSEKCNGTILADHFYFGPGNPMSPILFVGQEPSGDDGDSCLSGSGVSKQMLIDMGRVIREHLERCKNDYIFVRS